MQYIKRGIDPHISVPLHNAEPVGARMSIIRPVVATVKTILPKGKQYRKLLFGPAAGCVMAMDFKCHLRSYLGIYEYEILPHFTKMVRNGSNCFDIGGKDGYDALMMANKSRAKVASFECDPDIAQQMRRTFARNPLLPIQVVESYVGSENALGHLTIDGASHNFFVPAFIKLDIEGAEDEALAGARETLAQHRPSLIIEVHGPDKEEKCIEILRSFDYIIEIVDQGRWLKDPDRRGYNRWLAAYPSIKAAV